MSNYILVPLSIILAMVFVYLVARFASAAFYRSKKEFMEWYELVHSKKGDKDA